MMTKLILAGAILISLLSCKNEKVYPWNPDWDNKEQIEVPDTLDKPDDPAADIKKKPRYVWIDAAANFMDYANSEEKISEDMKKLAEIGFTDVIVDVRPSVSGVLFKSATEEPLKKIAAWKNGNFIWIKRTADFDYLQAFIDAGHKAGIRVNAAMNTFTGGCIEPYGLGNTGMLFSHPERKGWATVANTSTGLENVMDLDESGTRFLNPANDEVVEYLLDLIGELASYKELDGIVLDRCRYDDHGLGSDFSNISKEKFEKHIGKKIERFPDDLFEPGSSQLSSPVTEIQKKWLEFRAKNIHDFIEKASAKAHEVNPSIRFGAYVGGWYSSYYESGVNWASPKYDPYHEGHYSWATPEYKNYGYADHCDFMFIGAYAGTENIWGSGEWTMQGFCKKARNLFKGDVPFAGGPDIGNGTGFENGGCGNLIKDITEACINESDGLFIFDLCHIKMFDYWNNFRNAFKTFQ